MIQKPGFYVSNRIEQVGFRVFFPNGYGISVIIGPDCGSDEVSVRKSQSGADYFCKNAEIAVINSDGSIVPFQSSKSVKDHSNPEDLPQIISWAMNR